MKRKADEAELCAAPRLVTRQIVTLNHPLPSLAVVDDDSLCENESNVCFTRIDKITVYAIGGFSCIRLCVLHDYYNSTSHQRLKETKPLLLTAF